MRYIYTIRYIYIYIYLHIYIVIRKYRLTRRTESLNVPFYSVQWYNNVSRRINNINNSISLIFKFYQLCEKTFLSENKTFNRRTKIRIRIRKWFTNFIDLLTNMNIEFMKWYFKTFVSEFEKISEIGFELNRNCLIKSFLIKSFIFASFCNFYSLQKFCVYIVRIRVCMRIQIYWRYKEMSRLMLCNLGNASTAGNDTNNNANTNSSMEDDDYYPLPTIYRWVNSWSITYIYMYSYIN